MPWCDHAGRFSAVRLIVLALLLAPMAFVAVKLAGGTMGPRPINAAVHEIGAWTIRLIFLSLAVTPLARLLRWPYLMTLRRMIGVTAFAYALGHLGLYVADQAFDLQKVATEIVLRVYLAIGFVALLVLVAMAVTSTDGMARRMGARRWRALHRLVYGAALLAVIHFFMQTKGDLQEPWIMAGLYGWLMLWRVAERRRRGIPARWTPLILAPLAGLGTAGLEALHYHLKMGVDPAIVLMANLSFDQGVRPGAAVLAIGAAIALASALRG